MDPFYKTSLMIEPAVAVSMQNRFINQVYGWMTGALALTGLVAYMIYIIPALHNFFLGRPGISLLLMIGTLVLVMVLSAGFNRISAATAGLLFVVFSIMMGMMLSSIFVAYRMGSISTTFFVASGTFGVMSLYGYVTKRDLTTFANFLFMILFGLILALVVNLFLQSSMLEMIVSFVGILVFAGLTAYDTQKIKDMALGIVDGEVSPDARGKLAVFGALSLYLDFINLFLFLLNFFGRRR